MYIVAAVRQYLLPSTVAMQCSIHIHPYCSRSARVPVIAIAAYSILVRLTGPAAAKRMRLRYGIPGSRDSVVLQYLRTY